MAKTEIKMCCGHNSDILQCVGTKKITDYFVSWSKFDNGTVKYCKDHMKEQRNNHTYKQNSHIAK